MIKKLKVRNFLGIRETEIKLEKFNIFLGKNAQGKTSLKQAVIYSLLGALPLKKKEEPAIIRNGATSADVEIELLTGQRIVRHRTRTKCTMSGQTPIFPLPTGILSILWSSPWRMVQWAASREGKAFLSSLLEERNEENFRRFLLGQKVAPAEEIVAAYQKGGLEAAYNEAVLLRREKKRELKGLESILPPPNSKVVVGGTEVDFEKYKIEKIRKRKVDLENELKKLLGEKEKITRVAEAKTEIEKTERKIVELQKEKERLEVEIGKLEAGVEPVECPITGRDCPVPEWVDPGMKDKLTELKQLKKRKVEVEAVLNSFLQKKEELTAATAEKIPSNIDQKIEELQRKLEKGAAIIAAAEQYQRSLQNYQMVLQEKEKVKKEIELFDRLANLLDPKNPPAELQEKQKLEQFNQRLSSWTDVLGFGVRVNSQMELETERPLFVLSFSELYRLGVALIDTVAHTAGVKLLFLDDAEIVVQDTQRKFLSRLMELSSEYQIFLFGSTSFTKEKISPPTSTKVFWVENGLVEEL